MSEGVPEIPVNQDGALTVTCVDAEDCKKSSVYNFELVRPVSSGTFGVVYYAKMNGTNTAYAIKKVGFDGVYKTREVEIMRTLKHKNVCNLRAFYFSLETSRDNLYGSHERRYLHLIMEYVKCSLYDLLRHVRERPNVELPMYEIKSIAGQMFCALSYLHSLGICHRDIKPQNLLFEPTTKTIKICDFGSAKKIVAGEKNVSYICSRIYRAPELIMKSQYYDQTIDIWSAGCVLVELLTCWPLFPVCESEQHLKMALNLMPKSRIVEMASRLGINPEEFNIPDSYSRTYPSWEKILGRRYSHEVMRVLSACIIYPPTARLSASEILNFPLFTNSEESVVVTNPSIDTSPISEEKGTFIHPSNAAAT